MRKVTGIALATSALVLLSGCKMDGKGHHGHADAAAIEKQIRDIETQWNADYNAHNVDALAAPLCRRCGARQSGCGAGHRRRVAPSRA